jgi:putative redox protein
MVTMQLEYQGDLHCKAIHEPSGTELTTDAPKDNQGRGESFSPTDLVATALGSCMLTVMGIMARRIARLAVRIHIPHAISPENQQKLERAAHTCPVHKSLHPDVESPIDFTWG